MSYPINNKEKLCWFDKVAWMIAEIYDCSSLPNVIRLATKTKVQIFKRELDTSFNGDVFKDDIESFSLKPQPQS